MKQRGENKKLEGQDRLLANYKQAQTCCCPLGYCFLQPWEMCLTVKSDCTLTRISSLLPNTVIYVFLPSPHFLPCSLPPYTNLGFFLYYHISCAQYKCFKTCFSSIDSFQCLGKFGTGEPMVYSSKFTNMSTPPWRDGMFSCQ